MKTMKNVALLALLAASLGACGSTLDPDAGDLTDRTAYPQPQDGERYGTNVGSLVEKLPFVAMDGSAYGLGEVFADEKNRVLLLSSVAGWCSPCIQEQKDLAAFHREYGDRGLVVMAAMFQDRAYKPATLDFLSDWQAEYELPYSLVLDAPYDMLAFYDGNPPFNMVIDVDTMRILYKGAGFNDTDIRSVIESNLPK